MRFLRKIVDFYIFANIHVALATFSLTKLSLLYWQNDTNIVPVFVFFSTLLSYNNIRLFRVRTISTWFVSWLASNKTYLISISVVSFFISFYLLFKLNLNAVLILIPFGFLTFLYVLPPFISKKIALRKLPVFKIIIIALSWAGITVLFPLAQYGIFNSEVMWLFLRQFLFVIVLTLPFDIRDVLYDDTAIKTLPRWLGIKKAKVLGYLLMGGFIVITFFTLNISLKQYFIDILIALTLMVFLFKATTKQNKYYSAFWIESLPIAWLVLYFIVEI